MRPHDEPEAESEDLGTEAPAVSWRWQELLLALSALLVLFVVIVALRSHLDTFVRPARVAAIDTSRTTRERRATTLAGLVRGGLVADVDSAGESPRVFVGPAFKGLKREARVACMQQVWQSFYTVGDPGGAMLLVYDGRTRRLLGSYTPNHGLTLEQ